MAPARPGGRTERSSRIALGLLVNILLVDDEVSIRELLGEFLSGIGHQVTACENGQQAWQWLSDRVNRCDVVVADIQMPVMGGRELLRLIRESNLGVPVVLVSGQVNVSEEDAALAGAVGIIYKPFRLGDVAGALRRIVGDPEED